jgi:hypothetical protein
MDIESPRWEEYEQRFCALAERAERVEKAEPSLDRCRYFLCLYGENGMAPEEEFTFLDKMERESDGQLKRIDVDTAYWQDTVLFLP